MEETVTRHIETETDLDEGTSETDETITVERTMPEPDDDRYERVLSALDAVNSKLTSLEERLQSMPKDTPAPVVVVSPSVAPAPLASPAPADAAPPVESSSPPAAPSPEPAAPAADAPKATETEIKTPEHVNPPKPKKKHAGLFW